MFDLPVRPEKMSWVSVLGCIVLLEPFIIVFSVYPCVNGIPYYSYRIVGDIEGDCACV